MGPAQTWMIGLCDNAAATAFWASVDLDCFVGGQSSGDLIVEIEGGRAANNSLHDACPRFKKENTCCLAWFFLTEGEIGLLTVFSQFYDIGAFGNYTCNIMSFNFKRHNNTYEILKRHNHVFKNWMTFLCHTFWKLCRLISYLTY